MVKWNAQNWDTFYWHDTEYRFIINGADVEGRSLVISDLLTNEANTASFEIVNTYANKPVEGQEVQIRFKSVKIFAGRVTRVESEKLSNLGASSEFLFFVECTDWQVDLDKKLVVETYTAQTLNAIITDINTTYLTGFTITNVENPGPTIAKIQFNYMQPSECFQAIADMLGYDWYVDYEKDIHFFPFETNDAPLELEDNGEEFDDLIITPDTTQLRNRVFVRGGYFLSSLYTQDTITAVAGQTEFPIVYLPRSPFTVTVDAVGKTVGIENVDAPGTHDFLLNATEKLLKVDTIVMAGAEAVIMKFKYKVPVLTQVDDAPSQGARGTIEGDDGVKEHRIVDENINTDDWARDVGEAELKKYANPLVEGSFTSLYDGWRSGQRLHIDLTDRNIDEYYLIRDVTIEAIAPDKLLYTITFATFLQGFSWLLIKLLDRTNKVVIRDDETLDQIVVIPEEATATDSVPTTTLIAPPFIYGPFAGNVGVYNLAQYG